MAKWGTGGSSGGKKETKKEKSFFGVRLPGRLPDIGVTTDKSNPFTQVEDLVTGLPANLARIVPQLSAEINPISANFKGFGKEKSPLLHAIATSPVKTVKSLNPVDLGVNIGKGQFGKSELGKRIAEEGVLGTGLATVSDLSLLAGGAGVVGKSLGAGSLSKAANLERAAAATSRAAGLGKAVKVEDLAAAATKAAGRGAVQEAVDLQKAASQLDEAAKLRATKSTIPAKLTEKAQDVSRLGAELGNIPAKPYQLLAKGAGKVPAAVGSAVEAATERGLPGAKLAEKGVSKVSSVVKYAGDKAKIADLYYKNVTAPTTEALYRRLERGESVEAIRANLQARFPGSEAVFNKMLDDVAKRAERINATRPRGIAENFGGQMRTAWSKTPEEWQVEVDAATVKLKDVQQKLKDMPDGAETKAASKAVAAAKQEVTEASAMRKMSMQSQDDFMGSPAVAEAMTPPKVADDTAKAADDAIPEAGEPGGPNFEETNQFNRENIKATRAEFHNQVQEAFAPGLTAGQVIPDTQLPKGSKIDMAQELKQRDFTAWDPMTGKEVLGAKITPDTSVLPNQVFDEITRYSKYNQFDKANSKLLQAYDYATGKWKHTVLALSPRWHVGNIAGNVAMAMAAGVSPVEMLTLGRQALQMLKAGEVPAELLASGFHFSDETLMAMNKGPISGIRQATKHPIQASYQANQFVDDLNRSIVFLAKKKQGVSEQAAVQSALKAAGNFSRMTPFERNIIRRIVPFYAWQKHITKLVFRLPLEDPARVAWTLHMADMSEQNAPDPGAEGFNENTIGIGGQRLNLNALNPFASAVGFGAGKDAVTRAFNPLIGLATAAGTGASTKRGFEGVTTPDRDFGDAPTPLLGNLPRLAQFVGQQIPTTRQLQDLAAGETKTRFDTGQPMPTQYPDEAQGRLAQLAKFFGIDVKEDLEGKESQKVTQKKPGRKSSGSAKWSTR